jgi:signal transduction histidine kinase
VGLAGFAPLLVFLAAAGCTVFGALVFLAELGTGRHDQRVLLAVLACGGGLAIIRFGTVATLVGVRRLATVTRRLAGRWCGVPIADPYLDPRPSKRDPATWRDLCWVSVNFLVGLALSAALLAVCLVGVMGHGAARVTLVLLWVTTVTAGVSAAPWLLRGYGLLAHALLAPARQNELVLTVRRLTDTRTEILDAGAAEIRRIERDLHDGAQARLVAMGMTLDAAGQIIGTNPDAARALLYEARDASVKALAELRALVRGIHPPVLADRGLAEAIRALTMDTPLRISLASDLHGRLPAPFESAGYFAVSELLANVSKHAAARQTWIDIRHTEGTLRIGVTDDGHGGADPGRGTGLRGIERRLAAFDGVLAISSPPGGPTAVTMEIPCELSSPKTSSCSETA